MKNIPQMAEKLDVSAITHNSPRGAGDRLGRILEQTKPRWMGRAAPIPSDNPTVYMHRAELEAIKSTLVTALEIIDNATRR